MIQLSSYVQAQWIEGENNFSEIYHAVSGEKIAECSTSGLDFKSILEFGRNKGGPTLRAMTFHDRARMLKRLAGHLLEHKELFYSASKPTGATRNDAWIDVEGGIGTLFTYASKGRRELPDLPFFVDGALEKISKNNTFAGQHICVPMEGIAIHINAFNFPCWGMLEKLAPTILAGMPALIKPATSTAYVTWAMVKSIIESGILPEGALQLICGGVGDLFEHLSCQDVVTLTGSKTTGSKLKTHPKIIENSVRFNLEADSLNCAILAPDATPGSIEFELFVKEVARELTVKAGQKCTVIRRIIVPELFQQAVIEEIQKRLATINIGNPENPIVRMGPLVSRNQVEDVNNKVTSLLNDCELVSGTRESFSLIDADLKQGAFFSPLLLRCREPFTSLVAHSVEAFGPVSTLFAYTNVEEAIELAKKGGGSLVGSVFSAYDAVAKKIALGLAPFHGRLFLMNAYSAKESTGHGSPLPHLVHGGPGRAGGGEELGGIRSVFHYMQRTALQGSPQRLSHICSTWLSGAELKQTPVHPFQKYFEELEIGETFLTHGRTITEADIVNFAGLSGDYFYAHIDDIAAKESIFERRVAHGYLVLSIAAGLFVHPAKGPVLANYGLENLRFVKPVYIGDTIRARLTCKQKTRKEAELPQGVVAWDVEVTNQNAEPVAIYVILTLVRAKQALIAV